MGFLKETWRGFTNYLGATKEEVVSEWDEFQEESTTLEAQRIYNDMAERNGWNNDYGNDYDRGMEID